MVVSIVIGLLVLESPLKVNVNMSPFFSIPQREMIFGLERMISWSLEIISLSMMLPIAFIDTMDKVPLSLMPIASPWAKPGPSPFELPNMFFQTLLDKSSSID
jgi:hypothetical protein